MRTITRNQHISLGDNVILTNLLFNDIELFKSDTIHRKLLKSIPSVIKACPNLYMGELEK